MATVNPNPHQTDDQFLPSRCVTALFDTPSTIPTATAVLRKAGIADADIEVFLGPEGAARMNVDNYKQSTGNRLLQVLTKALADDAGYLEEAAALLRQGGGMVRVSTGDSENLAELVSSVLKAHGGRKVQHWGEWVTEQL